MRDRKAKVVTLSAIIVAMLLISIGFAAFSANLFISSGLTVNSNPNNFVVKFSTSTSGYVAGSVTPITTGSATGQNATISNTTASNLNATVTNPGETITYQFYAVNTGRFDAYLRSISFTNATGGSSFKKCTPGTDTNGITTNPDLVEAACASIRVTVTAGSLSTTTTDASITNHKISKNGYEVVTVVLEYVSGGAVADGPFTVEFGDIVFNYQTIDGGVETGVETPVESGLGYVQSYTPMIYAYTSYIGIGDNISGISDKSENTAAYPSYFLGLDYDGSGNVTTIYTCFKRNGKSYCLKGFETGTLDTTNVAILNSAFSDSPTACTTDGGNGWSDGDYYKCSDENVWVQIYNASWVYDIRSGYENFECNTNSKDSAGVCN